MLDGPADVQAQVGARKVLPRPLAEFPGVFAGRRVVVRCQAPVSPSVLTSLPGLCSHRSHSQPGITHAVGCLSTGTLYTQHLLGLDGVGTQSRGYSPMPGSLQIDAAKEDAGEPSGDLRLSLLSKAVICYTVSSAAQALGTDSSHPNSHVLSGVMGLEPGTEVLLGRERGDCPPLAGSPLLAALLELHNRSRGG